MRAFIHKRHYVAVGTANREPDGRWRLTTWRPDGPSGHEILTDREFEREVSWHWTEWPAAVTLLDLWSKTAEWEQGLKSMQFVAAWNTLTWLGHFDLAMDLHRCPSLDVALWFAPGLIARAREEKREG